MNPSTPIPRPARLSRYRDDDWEAALRVSLASRAFHQADGPLASRWAIDALVQASKLYRGKPTSADELQRLRTRLGAVQREAVDLEDESQLIAVERADEDLRAAIAWLSPEVV